jgi:nitrous oxide reductase accessory protein NosL
MPTSDAPSTRADPRAESATRAGVSTGDRNEVACGDCDHRRTSTVTRRRVLRLAGAAGVASLAGCLGGSGDGEAPDPVTVEDAWTCDVCGMVVAQHPGPTAELFYADRRPNGHDNPARFDSTWEAFSFDFERDDWSRQALYVTDYSAVAYEVDTGGPEPTISRHVEASAFADAADVTFVVGSEVVGAMGRDLLGFGDRADAEAFADEYGGDLGSADEVSPATIASLGT